MSRARMQRDATRWLAARALVVALVLVAGACSSDPSDDRPPHVACNAPRVDDGEVPIGDGPPFEEAVPTRIADVDEATSATFDPRDGSMLVTTKLGEVVQVTAFDGGPGETVLDLTDEVNDEEAEQGLLSAVVDPEGEHLYVAYTDHDDALVVEELSMVGSEPDPGSARTMLVVDQPDVTHNGGSLVLDEDGLLWIGVGDGASSPEGDVMAMGNAPAAQDLSDLYGTILRIDPTPDGDDPYTIPPDNPFVDDPGARDEIWAYGLRNPWRFSVDAETGDLWIGDVGQFCFEEINLERGDEGAGAGANFGWPAFEGRHEYRAEAPDDHVLPLYEMDRSRDDRDLQVCSVIGGYRYWGEAIPKLQGAYVYGDVCHPEVFALFPAGDDPQDGWVRRSLGFDVGLLVSFAQDPRGELYAVSLIHGINRLDHASILELVEE